MDSQGRMADPTMQHRGGGEGGGMRTVECLRGRLLAERVASKAAKEEADQLAQRLDELEKKLSNEVKMRNKAERRLRRAVKKLESLKTLDAPGLSAESSVGSLSSNGCSGHQAPEMEEERNSPGLLNTVVSGPLGGSGSGEAKEWDGDSARGSSSAGSCTQVNSSQDGSWFSVVSEQSGSCSGPCKEENRMHPDDAKNCAYGEDDAAGGGDHDSEREQVDQPAASNGSSKSSETYRDEDDDRLALVLVGDPHHSADGDARAAQEQLRAAGEEESNELAIVLADPQPPPRRPAEARGGSDVESVLLALRQVKEQLRYTIERRSERGLVAHRELYGH